jgi:phage/plasmid primase-like uncharacterized protein
MDGSAVSTGSINSGEHKFTKRQLSHNDVVAQFCDAMRATGLIVNASDIVTDSSKFQRCKSEKDRGSRRNGFYKLWLDGRPAGVFGNWATGESHTWAADTGTTELSREEKAKLRAEMKQRQAERAAEIKEAQNKAAERAKKAWDKAVPADDSHPYLVRKGVKAHGLRVGKWWGWDAEAGKAVVLCENALLVPMHGLKKSDIRSLQAIFPDKIEIHGDLRDKTYLSSGERLGVFHVIGKPQEVDGKLVFVVAEGYATAASIHEATGHCALVAFDAGNLLHTAQVIRGKYPDATIVIAADNDQFTVKPVANPGVFYARKAAVSVNGLVAIPQFDDLDGKPTDFNDLHQREGDAAVEHYITAALYPAEAEHEADTNDGDRSDADLESLPMDVEQHDNCQYAPAEQRAGVQIGGMAQGADKPLLSPQARQHLNAAMDAHDNTGPWPMGRSGDLHVFVTSRKEVVFLRQQDLFRDHGILELKPLDAWEVFLTVHGKAGGKDKSLKLDRTLVGNHLLELSSIIGEFSTAHVPVRAMRPDVLARKVAIAEMRARPSAQAISHVLLVDPSWSGAVWWNEFAMRVEARTDLPCGSGAGPWTDLHDKLTCAWLTAKYGVNVSRMMVADAVELIAHADSRHPVRDYLRTTTWDGKPRIDGWLSKYAGVVDNVLTRAFASKTLIGAVARIMKPGCKFDTILVMEGDQGLKKSSLIEALCHNREWFSSSLKGDLESKDAAIGLAGKWILEMQEMAASGRSRPEVTKCFLSEKVDNYRAPYAMRAEDHPRQCAFIGTINPEADGRYLHDTTGGRRFWPVLITRTDVDYLIEDRDQLWAEALHRYDSGEQWWLPNELEALAKVAQADRQEANVWDEHVERYLEYLPPDSHDGTWGGKRGPAAKVSEFLSSEIFRAITGRPMVRKDTADSRAIAVALKAKGWVQKQDKSRKWVRADDLASRYAPSDMSMEQARQEVFG